MELGIDIESLAKGDVISDATIRQCVAEAFGETDDPVEFLKFRHFWAESLKSALRRSGRMYTVRWVADELCILTDQAASKYNAKRFASGRRGLRRRNELMAAIDRSELTREQRELHDREVIKQGAILSASDRAVRQMPPVVARRQTPVVRPPQREQQQRVI